MGREHGLAVGPACWRPPDPPDRDGIAPGPTQKGLLLVRTPTTLGNLCCSQPASRCTPRQRFCTRRARLDEGYPQTLEAPRLGHFSIVYAQESACQIYFPRVGVRSPQDGRPLRQL